MVHWADSAVVMDVQISCSTCVSLSDGFSSMVEGVSLIHNTSLKQGASAITQNTLFSEGLLPLQPHQLVLK